MDLIAEGSKTNLSCDGTPDLQQQLRQLLETAVTPSRAEHVATTFTFRSNAAFHLTITEAENEAFEHAGNVDPSLGEGRTGSAAPAHANSGLVSRDVGANETIMNQPQDNPVLQRAVAKHLIAALGDIDGSNWVVRGVSRLNHGWTFTYICKDSRQEWKRQSSKRVYKTAIAEYSAKDGSDPVHLSRPAFDCRGAVTISFVKATRTIQVKYDHTVLHKSVAQLIDLLAPPPPPSAPVVKKPVPQPAGEGRKKSKAKRKTDGLDGAEGPTPKRRRKTTGDATDGDTVQDGIAPEGAAAGEAPSGKPAKKRTYKKRSKSASGQEPAVSVEEAEPAPAEAPAAASYGVNAYGVLNLPPGEAERRRAAAMALLEDKGIDPKTLSEDQFNIFANQSPDLQRESLAMLVKYGAERLRIVHPNKEGEQASAGPTPAAAQSVTAAVAGGQAVAGPEGVSSLSSPANAMAQGGRNADGAQSNGKKSQPKTPRVRETRGACDNCKSRRTKCPKERPSCAECLEAGLQCYYALAKSKKKAEIEPEEGEQDPQHLQFGQESGGQGLTGLYQPTTGPFALDPDLRPTGLHDADDIHSGSQAVLSHPLPAPDSSSVASQLRTVPAHDPAAGLTYPSSQFEVETQNATQQSTQYPDPDSPVAPQASPKRTSKRNKNSRHSLPTAPQPAVPNWNTATSSPMGNANGASARPDRGIAQRSRTQSRQAQRGHSSTPAQEQTSASYHQHQVPAASSAADQPSYSSSTASTTDPSGLSGYNTYSNYSGENTDQSSTRAVYVPYTDPAISTTPYQAFDTYNSGTGGTSSATLPAGISTSYPSALMSTNQWSAPSQPRSSSPYSVSNSANVPNRRVSGTHSPSLQGGKGRPPPPASSRNTSTSSFASQPQQSRQLQQQQQHQQQHHQQQHSSFSMYSSQPAAHASSSSSPSSANHQQNWYSFTSVNAAPSAYGGGSSRAAGGGAAGSDNSYVDMSGHSSNSHNQPNRRLHPQPPGWA